MIITVTLSPSVDRTIEVDALRRGGVLRATGEHVHAGGKGINVTRVLAAHGARSRAVLPVGGGEGHQLVDMLTAAGVEFVGVPVSATARCNIAVTEPDGTVTKINATGQPLSQRELDACATAVLVCAVGATWIVAGGSLPFGVPDTWYADLIDRLRPSGVPVAVDTSGPALAAAIKAGPALVKPNREELAAAVGGRLDTLGDAVAAATELHRAGAGTVLASLGRDGAVLVSKNGTWHGETPVAASAGAVGAGDAMLAGFLHGGAAGPVALTVGLAWGAAAATLPGSRLPGPDDVRMDLVRVHEGIDSGRRLSDES
ncbi:MAG TPA: 1-phosphofructokinase family hexose kinase [Pseudonocardiaceae bacterium]|nr:1-phosphofructokinase family hexose kinase [Pseudonocardiaceae bacterium]